MTNSTGDNNLYAVSSLPVRDSLLLLDVGDIQFFLQGDVVSLLPINAMQTPLGECACGSLVFETERLPVFYLNQHLQLQASAAERCNAVVILSADASYFCLAVCDLQKYIEPAPVFYQVPISMSSRKQPFNEFAVINNRAVGLTSAAELLRVLRLRGVTITTSSATARQQAAHPISTRSSQ